MKRIDTTYCRERGWQMLSNNWPVAIGTSIVTSLLGGGTYSTIIEIDMDNNFQLPEFLTITLLLYGILVFIIGSAINTGYKKCNITLIDTGYMNFGELFTFFNWKMIGKTLITHLLISLYLLLYAIPLVGIPLFISLVGLGSIAYILLIAGTLFLFYIGLRYQLTFYILAENPSMDAGEAIDYSENLMVGHEWDYIRFILAFIPWLLLVLITCGLAAFVLGPYQAAAEAAFYRELNHKPGHIPENDSIKFFNSMRRENFPDHDNQPWEN